MSTLKTAVLTTAACFAASCTFSAPASAFTLVSPTLKSGPPIVPIPNATLGQTIVSGDFTIEQQRITGNRILGDGIDEAVSWSFDLSSAFNPISVLTTAKLKLDLTPGSNGVKTDFLRLTLPGIQNILIRSPFQAISSLAPQTIEVNLLDFIAPDRLIQSLNLSGGIVSFEYKDDAVISSAQLTLSSGNNPTTSVPEPSSALGILVGIGAIGSLKRQRK